MGLVVDFGVGHVSWSIISNFGLKILLKVKVWVSVIFWFPFIFGYLSCVFILITPHLLHFSLPSWSLLLFPHIFIMTTLCSSDLPLITERASSYFPSLTSPSIIFLFGFLANILQTHSSSIYFSEDDYLEINLNLFFWLNGYTGFIACSPEEFTDFMFGLLYCYS